MFGRREGVSPTFTSFKGWLGHPLSPDEDAVKKLTRKFLHCYGPTTAGAFASWLGCSGKQARRMWAAVADEVEPVELLGKKAYVLSEDMDLLTVPPMPQRELLLLGGHDPYLDQRDRDTLLGDKTLQKRVWTTVSNPGAVVKRGEIIGIWTSRMKGSGMEIKITLWDHGQAERQALQGLAEEYAAFRGQDVTNVDISN